MNRGNLEFSNQGDWMFKVVPAFIGFVFISIILYWIFIAVVGVKIYNEVDKHGVKSIVERVWNGDTIKH